MSIVLFDCEVVNCCELVCEVDQKVVNGGYPMGYPFHNFTTFFTQKVVNTILYLTIPRKGGVQCS